MFARLSGRRSNNLQTITKKSPPLKTRWSPGQRQLRADSHDERRRFCSQHDTPLVL